MKTRKEQQLEQLMDRVEYWTDDEGERDLWAAFYTFAVDTGIVKGDELATVRVDNDFVNNVMFYYTFREAKLDGFTARDVIASSKAGCLVWSAPFSPADAYSYAA